MASSLIGFKKRLTWDDFGTPRNTDHPVYPGAWAYTSTGISFNNPAWEKVSGGVILKNEFKLTVTLRSDSFVLKKVFADSELKTDQDNLLNHEQGHYDVTALICRDFFVDCMLLKGQTFATEDAGNKAVTALKGSSGLNLLSKAQKKYDHQVHPEQDAGKSKGPKQIMWNGFFLTAKTKERSNGTTNLSGAVKHKVRLVDVLSAAGVKLA